MSPTARPILAPVERPLEVVLELADADEEEVAFGNESTPDWEVAENTAVDDVMAEVIAATEVVRRRCNRCRCGSRCG